MADHPSGGVFEFAEFRLLAAQRRLVARADGRPIDLTQKAFDALLYLVRRPGELLDKATLLKAIWPNVVVEENNLNQVISTLRRALADGQDGQRFIVTVPGRGYQFVAEVREDPAPADRAAAPVPEPALQTSTDSAQLASIAVLPFVSLSNDPEKDFFGDGIAEELIHLLARVPGLKVPARTSSFAYKGRNTDIRTIAKDLGVATVLEGSVRSDGERIRVTAQLINAQTGFHLWSQSYDRRYEGIFKLQDELASAILQALQVNLDGKSPAAVLPEPPTPNLEAYQLYLQGHALVWRGGLDDAQTGMRMLEKAIAIDPNFGRAYAALAGAQYHLVIIGAAAADLLSEVERNSQRSLALDPAIQEAYASLCGVSVYRARWLDAEQYCRKALSLNPADPVAHIFYGAVLLPALGRLRAALRASQDAYRLAPAVPLAAMGVAVASTYLGRDSDTTAYTQLAVDLGMPRSTPPLPFLDAAVAMNAGRYAEAAEHMDSVLASSVLEARGAAVVRLVYAAAAGAGDTRAAIEALQALRAGVAGEAMARPIMVMLSTLWFTQLGALDLAYELAQAALQEFESTGVLRGAIHVATCWLPEMRPFRQDPRFQHYVRRLGLMEYWQQYGSPDDCDLQDGKLICH
jgi:TolB-like protein/Tfp pilus assembly protein PilF